jgi:hypothetical protein
VFIMATLDRNTNLLSLYINGVLYATTSFSGLGSVGQSQPLAIAGNGYTLNGLIDDVRVYNRALSAAEISNIYSYEANLYQ